MGLAFLFLLGAAQAHAASAPNWVDEAASARLVFRMPPKEAFCLVTAPARMDRDFLTGSSAWTASGKRDFRLVWADDQHIQFLIQCGGVATQQEATLYLRAGTAPPVIPDTGLIDPTPVCFTAVRAGGQDLPATWEQLQMLETRVDSDPVTRSLASIKADENEPSGWQRDDWQRRNNLVRFKTWFSIPTAGRVLFGLRTGQAHWLLVDGVPLMDPPAQRRSDWNWSRPTPLAVGLHRVEVRGVVREQLRLATQWRMEGRNDASGVFPITGGEEVRARFERRDHRLHALAVATPESTYTFDGTTNTFTFVKLESRSVSWDRRPMTAVWQLDGSIVGTGLTVRTVLANRSRTARIGLTVTDDRGHVAQDEQQVPADAPPRKVYRVSGRLFGVPPVAYEDDPVRPVIQVRASSPDNIDFNVSARIDRGSAPGTNLTGFVDIVRTWGRWTLPQEPAGAIRRIVWQVEHAGVVVDAGTTVVERTPFQFLPDAMDGDNLRYKNETVSLIARRASAGNPIPVEKVCAGQRVLLLDGWLASFAVGRTQNVVRLDQRLSRVVENDPGTAVAFRRVDLRAMEKDDSAEGVARLQPLVQVGALLPADVIVIAPTFYALSEGDSTELFERRLSALVGLLTGPGHAQVFLVTPPPFDHDRFYVRLPDSREMAEIVCRVADAYGMPVVDLYTGFLGADSDEAWTDGTGVLTAGGLEQATTMIRNALYGRQRTTP